MEGIVLYLEAITRPVEFEVCSDWDTWTWFLHSLLTCNQKGVTAYTVMAYYLTLVR